MFSLTFKFSDFTSTLYQLYFCRSMKSSAIFLRTIPSPPKSPYARTPIGGKVRLRDRKQELRPDNLIE